MFGLTLEDAASYAEIFGALSIFTGLAFGLIQLKSYQAQQRDTVAINLMQTFYDQDFSNALALLHPLPDGITLKELRDLGPEYPQAAISVATSFETMGLLAYRNIASLDLVLDLAGGIVSTMNKRLKQWQQDGRAGA